MKTKKCQEGTTFLLFISFIIIGVLGLVFFSFGWDTGIMTGKLIGYDSNLFGTKTVFILEDKTVYSQDRGMSQSEIKLCSDFDDTEIHKLIEQSLNKKVKIEYKEKRIGFYALKYCHEAPITNITILEDK